MIEVKEGFMELKTDQVVLVRLRDDNHDIEKISKKIESELLEYRFRGSKLFDLFFYIEDVRYFAQGRIVDNYAHCYDILTITKQLRAIK